MPTDFRRTLPDNPDLEQQKTQAKELLAEFRAGAAEAQTRVRAQLPDKPEIALADAQFTIAREYGFPSWGEMKRHIEERSAAGSPIEALRAALQKHDARALRRLLQKHPDLRARINDPVFSFDAPAITAFANDEDPAVIEVLLEFGADPNRRSSWWAGGFHALHGASPAVAEKLIAAGAVVDACAAAHLDRIDILERLIAEDPARVHERGGDGQTPLHFARSRSVVDLLLEKGADINARDVDHRSTAAEWMIERRKSAGRYDLARYLVQRGASADIFLAAALGLTARAEELLAANPKLLELRTTQGDYGEKPPSSYHIYMWTIGPDLQPMQVALQFEQAETLAVMRAYATSRQLLLSALAEGNAGEVRRILRETPDALDQLSVEDRRILPEAAWTSRAPAVQLMLDLGFDPLTPNGSGATALHCAAWEGSAECVRILLQHPDAAQLVNVREPEFGATPFGWCCHGSVHGNRNHAHAEVARMLLAAGARLERDPGEAGAGVRAAIDEWRREHERNN